MEVQYIVHHGVPGMKWGVRRASKRVVKGAKREYKLSKKNLPAYKRDYKQSVSKHKYYKTQVDMIKNTNAKKKVDASDTEKLQRLDAKFKKQQVRFEKHGNRLFEDVKTTDNLKLAKQMAKNAKVRRKQAKAKLTNEKVRVKNLKMDYKFKKYDHKQKDYNRVLGR